MLLTQFGLNFKGKVKARLRQSQCKVEARLGKGRGKVKARPRQDHGNVKASLRYKQNSLVHQFLEMKFIDRNIIHNLH